MSQDKLQIISDVDGILTSANITFAQDGKKQKHFGVNDSLIMTFIQEVYADKVDILFLTGDSGAGLDITKGRLDYMSAKMEHCKNAYKYAWIKEKYDISKIVYFGDDIYDFVVMEECAYSATVSNAPFVVKQAATYISPYEGGKNGFTDMLITTLQAHAGLDVKSDMRNYVKSKKISWDWK